eukprot:gene13529-28691_t
MEREGTVTIEADDKTSANHQRILHAKLMDEKLSNNKSDDFEYDSPDEEDKASSHRQKILQAQIMDEKMTSRENEEFDEVDPMISELTRVGVDQIPETNQNALNEMDNALSSLRDWQQRRVSTFQKHYNESMAEGDTKESEGGIYSDWKTAGEEDEERPETLASHVADEKAISSLQALLRKPLSKGVELTDLSCLDEQLDRASSGYPSPEKLRRELRELTFTTSSRE